MIRGALGSLGRCKEHMRLGVPDRGEHCLPSEISANREAAVGSRITALPFGKPFGADCLENSCGY